MTGSSIGGLLLGIVARPPLPLLRLAGSLPVMGLSKTLFFVETEERRLALTLDDGPHADTTEAVLERLDEHRCKATFFLHGCQAKRCPDLVQTILSRGHELGNHTWEDKASRKLPSEAFRHSLDRTHRLLTRLASARGEELKFFRPAGGWPSEKTVAYAKSKHTYRTVLASIYPLDTRIRSAPWIAEAIVRRAHPGAIIVLHEGAGRGRVASILDQALPCLTESYAVTTVSDLLSSATPGR